MPPILGLGSLVGTSVKILNHAQDLFASDPATPERRESGVISQIIEWATTPRWTLVKERS